MKSQPVGMGDRIGGCLLACLGAAAYYGGSLLPPVPGQQVGPSVFPMVIGVALFFCGVLISLGIGRTFEESERVVVSQDGDVKQLDELADVETWQQKLKMLAPPAAVFFYAFFSERIGFWLCAMIIVGCLAWSMRAKLKHAIWLIILAPALIHLIFYKLLRVPLPRGWLWFPWS